MTVEGVASTQPPRGSRPRNRRKLIIAAATGLFASDGYGDVSMADIADAVSVRPSAIYRHFRGKGQVLYEVVSTELESIRSTVRMLGGVHELAEAAVDHRQLGVLWHRESRHLEPARREILRAALVEISGYVSEFVSSRRPGLRAEQRDVLAWAMLASSTSLSFQQVELPRGEYIALLSSILERIVDADLNVEFELSIEQGTRREDRHGELVDAAATLFARRGYHSVGVDDVGAEVGISGPSIYHHFSSKLELVAAVLRDAAAKLTAPTERVLESSTSDEEVLTGLLRTYCEFSFSHSDLIDVMIAEGTLLPEPYRSEFKAVQRRYLGEWLRTLSQARAEWPRSYAHTRLQMVLSTINDIARTHRLSSTAGVPETVAAICHDVLAR